MQKPLNPSADGESIVLAVWEETLSAYAADGVKTACLALQSAHGVGVSALLALLSLTKLGLQPPVGEALEKMLERSEQWQKTVIEPLRQARRAARLDAGSEAMPVLAEATETLYQSLLKREIEAERVQQRLLMTDGLALCRDQATGVLADRLMKTAQAYMGRFTTRLTVADQRAIEQIIAPFID